MSTNAVSPVPDARLDTQQRRLVLTGTFGTGFENYDMFIYALIGPAVFDHLFFPKADAHVALLLVFATFAIGFLGRPVGSIFFGHYGDRIGRKPVLVITLVLMGAVSCLIGVLPGYARIGIWAPILLVLFRLLQGFSLGGQTGGAAVLTIENVPQKRRGFYAACVQMGAPLGALVASAIVALLTGISSKAVFQTWLWRIPFLLSAVLIFLGWYVHAYIDESVMLAKKAAKPRVPIVEILRHWKKSLVLGMLCVMSHSTFMYLVSIFAISIATKKFGMSISYLTAAFVIANFVELCMVPVYGYLSDRTGRRFFLMVGIALCAAFVYPVFRALQSRNQSLLAILMIVGLGFLHPLLFSQEPSFTSELWPTQVRYSGASVCKHLGSVLGGGLAPLVATALMGRGLSLTPVIYYYWCIAVCGFIAAYLAPESSKLLLTADKWTTQAQADAQQAQSASAK